MIRQKDGQMDTEERDEEVNTFLRTQDITSTVQQLSVN